MNTIDLQALYLSGSYCHQNRTRPPSCGIPRQPTIYARFLPSYFAILETDLKPVLFVMKQPLILNVYSKSKADEKNRTFF